MLTRNRSLLYVLLGILFPLVAAAQDNDSTLSSTLSKGRFNFSTRTFFMSTINEGELSDSYALATGFGLSYQTPEFRKFSVGLGGYTILNVASSNLEEADPVTKMVNRYEVGLFDVSNPERRTLNRLEDLYVQYRFRNSTLRVGRFLLNTPFINAQDGRMRPTWEEGIWGEVRELKDVQFSVGWITRFSPRSTVEWYKVGNSIGLYPVGLNEQGVRSRYAGNLSSKGVGIAGVEYDRNGVTIALWDTFIENISNTALLMVERTVKSGQHKVYAGTQIIRQDAVGNGGNIDPVLAYQRTGSFSNIISARLGFASKQFEANLNGTYISKDSRYLMPREWGRDPFYTFMPRERNEGYGNVKAITMNVHYKIGAKTNHLRASGSAGYFALPPINDFTLNKYAMPSYIQFNADLRYNLQNYFKGGNVQLLYVYKRGTKKQYESPTHVMNKVNMSNINLVFTYSFSNIKKSTP